MALFVSYEDTLKLKLDMNELIELFEEAHRLLAQNKGTYGKRLRVVFPPVTGLGTGRPWTHDMRILPAILPGIGSGLRVGTTKKGDKPGQGTGGCLLIFFDSETMEWKAAISDSLIHGVRSAVPDGMAAKHLSLANSKTLGVIGSGRIAQWATRAVCAVRPIQKIKVYSPNPDHRKSYVSLFTKEMQVDVTDFDSPEPVVRDSDIVTAATSTAVPVLNGDWLKPGSTFITNTPEEMDRTTAKRAKLIASIKEEVNSHVPPYQAVADLMDSGELTEADLSVEMGDIILGIKPGRTSDDEIIAYMNSGSGIYDVAISSYVYKRAMEQGLGVTLTP